MCCRPFIFQNVVVDRQRSERIGCAVTECRADFAFHPENPSALHFREIGKDVRVRCEIDNRQLWRDVFNRERNDAHAHLGGAELAHGQRVKAELQGCAFDQIVCLLYTSDAADE